MSDADILAKYGAAGGSSTAASGDAGILAKYGAHPGQNPVAGAVHAVGGVLERLGVPRAMDLLDRPRQTVQAAIAGDQPLHTFLHHADAAQQNRDRAAVRAKIGMPGAAERAQAGGLRGGADDFLTDTLTDPVSYLSAGVAPLAKGLFRGAAAGVGALEKVLPGAVGRAREYGQAAGDAFTHGGSAKRELGDETFHGALAADNRQSKREEEAARILTARYEATLGKLPEGDRHQVYQVLNGERDTRGMPAHLVDAVAQGRKLTHDAGALWGDQTARRKLAYGGGRLAQKDVLFRQKPPVRTPPVDDGFGGTLDTLLGMKHPDDVPRVPGPRKLTGRVDRQYDLPPELRDFAAPEGQGILKAGNIRSDYLPAPHAADADLVARDARPRPFNLLTPRPVNAEQREAFQAGENEVPALDESFRGMLAQAARQGTAGRMREEVGVRAGGNANPALVRMFERTPKARGDARTLGEKAGEDWQRLVNIPKNTVTTIGLAHGLKNVPDLALRSEGPGAAAEALALGARITAEKDPAKRYALLREGIEGGVIGSSDVRENPIADFLAKLPGVGPTIGKASQKANQLTWAIDDAAKQAVYRRKIARGMSPTDAAAETLREMVDYRHRSKATEAVSRVAPFATFRMGIPGAVGSSTLRDPRRALAYDRVTSGLASTGKVDVDQPDGKKKHVTMTTPGSDVYGLENPFKYGRAMMADPIKGALTGGADVFIAAINHERESNGQKPLSAQDERTLRYFTYGQPLLPHKDKDGKIKAGFIGQQVAGYAPLSLGGQVLNAVQAGEFPQEDPLSALLGGTVGLHVR